MAVGFYYIIIEYGITLVLEISHACKVSDILAEICKKIQKWYTILVYILLGVET